ncbi:metal-dependent hydrolase [Viridibacterium curvum]|uniref:Metal-dependent hydrolase n=1 Tax=Viridibacterium curvum TaxID=1101404 RepID=A0ABP9QUG8_9RHOO
MDSLSQLALGASLGVAVMGRRTAVWKAALWGGVAGTLPDLDVFIDYGDPLANMVGHRGFSHSLIYLSLLAPALAWLVWRIHGRQAPLQRWGLAIWLALITHPLLDACTVYGTRLLLPFTDHAYGTGSVFIIDPLYTLPLCVGVVAALWRGAGSGLRWNAVGIAVSTAYLAWGLGVQAHVRSLALAALPAEAQGSALRLLVTPAPLNTVLWRVVAQNDTHYFEGFYSLFDAPGPIRFRRYDTGSALANALPADNPARRLQAFASDFVRFDEQAGVIGITDLRMGQEPYYVFSFTVAERAADGSLRNQLPRAVGSRGDVGEAWQWLTQRVAGHDVPPPGTR